MVANLFSDKDRFGSWAIFTLGCVFYAFNLDFALGGDAIYYANIIDTLRFDKLTAHQAYYLIGFLCKYLFGWLFGLSTGQSLVLMSALFGAASLCTGYLLLKNYLGSGLEALLGSLILLLCYRFYINATTAEIYIVQSFFVWSSYLLFEKKRFYIAGVLFALALWASPLTIAFGLFFPVVAYLRGFGIYSLIRVTVPVFMIYVPFLLFFYEELLWGVRGVIEQDEARDIDIAAGAYDFFRYQIKHYSVLNLLLIPALFALRREKQMCWISLAVILPNIYVISQLRGEDNVFILTLDVFFTYWIVIGWRFIYEKSLVWMAIVLLLFHSIVFLGSEKPFLTDSNNTYDDEIRKIGSIIRNSENSILFAKWSQRMAMIYYNRDVPSYPLEAGYWYETAFDIDEIDITSFNNVKADPESFDRYESVFVLESYMPSMQAQLFLDDDELNKRYERMSERRQLERFLDVECYPIHSGILTLYKCR